MAIDLKIVTNAAAEAEFTITGTGPTVEGTVTIVIGEDGGGPTADITLYSAYADRTIVAAFLDVTGQGLTFTPSTTQAVSAVTARYNNRSEYVRSDNFVSADGTVGLTADVAVAKVGGGTRTLSFKNGLYTGYTDS